MASCAASRPGNCWDNAVAESFFSTLKIELVHDADWATHVGKQAEGNAQVVHGWSNHVTA
jgi:transposase InsO family protein